VDDEEEEEEGEEGTRKEEKLGAEKKGYDKVTMMNNIAFAHT